MTRKFSISLAAAALVLAWGPATLHAEEPAVDGSVVAAEAPAEVFPVEIEAADLPTAEEALKADLGLGTPEPLEQRCICVSFKASCESICGDLNYNFECYPTSHVFCECIEGGGGFYHTCS